jgi:hypothetical protein
MTEKHINHYFHINNKSISRELCNDMINLFEQEPVKYRGITSGGLNIHVKNTTDFVLPLKTDATKWSRIREYLEKELEINVQKYINNINNGIRSVDVENSDIQYTAFAKKCVSTEKMMMQKYNKNEGQYIYHDDFDCEFAQRKYRVITFLWYINDVEDGGETEFWGEHKIKPEAGKLLLFPASWTFPHRGKMPISSNKYIITGWLYLHK